MKRLALAVILAAILTGCSMRAYEDGSAVVTVGPFSAVRDAESGEWRPRE